jgi:myo-inositol-1(or 4)-monophosphatase
VARFARPNVWDVAAGIPLLRAAGRQIRMRTGAGWMPLEAFETEAGGDIRSWRNPLVIGEPDAVAQMCEVHAN